MEEKKVKRAKGNRKVIISGVLAGALLFASVSEINLTKNEIKADAVSVKADITKELTEKRNSFVKQFAYPMEVLRQLHIRCRFTIKRKVSGKKLIRHL